MEQIRLEEGELADMRQFYLEEYEKTRLRLDHIMAILKRIGAEAPETLDQGTEKKTKKKPGRKPQWENLIIKRLRQLDRPVTYEELTDEIMLASKLPPEKRQATKQAVINVVFRLRNKEEKLKTFSMGKREKYIAMNGWFTKQGKIRREYANRIQEAR